MMVRHFPRRPYSIVYRHARGAPAPVPMLVSRTGKLRPWVPEKMMPALARQPRHD
jgi:hypothetical protein